MFFANLNLDPNEDVPRILSQNGMSLQMKRWLYYIESLSSQWIHGVGPSQWTYSKCILLQQKTQSLSCHWKAVRNYSTDP